jgi:hypothetical protein
MALLHINAKELLSALAILKTKELNQNALTTWNTLSVFWSLMVYWIVVAVTAEKKVAIVARV